MATADDKSSIHLLVARLCDAWARGDGEGYAACFAQESDYITFNGLHLRSRAENEHRITLEPGCSCSYRGERAEDRADVHG